MKRIEYIKQLPGMKNNIEILPFCPSDIGLDEDYCGNCELCWNREAVIYDNPAPHLYACPLALGQEFYVITDSGDVRECVVGSVSFNQNEWYVTADQKTIRSAIRFYVEDFDEDYDPFPFSVGEREWMKTAFPTREAAEWKIKEMQK